MKSTASSTALRAAALALLFAGAAAPALAQQPATGQTAPGAGVSDAEDPVVARVNGQPILRSEVKAAIAQLPAQFQGMPQERLFQPILDQMIANRIVAQAAEQAGVEETPEFRTRFAAMRERLLQQTYLEQEIDKRLTDERLREVYEKIKAENPPQPELRARHILVEDEARAKEIVAELEGGADFAEIAARESKDPGSAAEGGDLGWFSPEVMVPEFSQAALALEPGAYTTEPVQSQFGWHVIKLEERRTPEFPPFEELRDQLAEQQAQTEAQAVVEELRKAAEVEVFQPDGTPVPAEPATQPQQ